MKGRWGHETRLEEEKEEEEELVLLTLTLGAGTFKSIQVRTENSTNSGGMIGHQEQLWELLREG